MGCCLTTVPASVSLALIFVCQFAAGAALADDADPGHAQFLKSCGTCHTVEKGADIRQGPNLGTVYGRKAGTLAEFPTYSAGLKKAGTEGLVWTEETLDKWVTSPQGVVADAAMFYSQADPEKRKIIIGYLKSLADAAAK